MRKDNLKNIRRRINGTVKLHKKRSYKKKISVFSDFPIGCLCIVDCFRSSMFQAVRGPV